MKTKGFFKTILIFGLFLWAVYALWPTLQVLTMPAEKKTQLEEEGKLVTLTDRAIHLGLDLQGGMYINLEVDLPRLVEDLAVNRDDQFEKLLEETREEVNVSDVDFLPLLQQKFEAATVPLNRYWGDRGDSEDDVIKYLRKQSKEAMDRSLEILRNRIDQFGVSEPSIQKVGSRRILIELPGISNPDQAKELIGKTALLEFKLLKDPSIFKSTIEKIDKHMATELHGSEFAEAILPDDTTSQNEEAREEQKVSEDDVVSVSEIFGDEEIALGDEEISASEEDTSLLVDKEMFEENPFLALLRTAERGGSEVIVPMENVNAVNRILAREDVQSKIPPNAEFLWSSEEQKVGDRSYKTLYLVNKDAALTGKYLQDARVNIGSDVKSAGRPVVNFTLDRAGARIIGRVSGANIGKRMAVVLDQKVFTAPVIQSKLGASSQITGSESMEDAQLIAIILKAGALPAPVSIIEERTVGASLGEDSIRQGTGSALIGMCIVILFMLIYYKMSGIVANVALIFNLILLFAVLAQFGFVLTLPGVAGIVLTIGMAVDANVLVFERIREELRTGKTVRASIDAGYSRAFKSILDANITTLLTALVLYQFGSGPIRGFAVTLSIGIIVSMFTALVVTRAIFDTITSRWTLKTLSI